MNLLKIKKKKRIPEKATNNKTTTSISSAWCCSCDIKVVYATTVTPNAK